VTAEGVTRTSKKMREAQGGTAGPIDQFGGGWEWDPEGDGAGTALGEILRNGGVFPTG